MESLYEHLAGRVAAWRGGGYLCDDFPVIAEILEWAGESAEGDLRYLRRPQLRALETYWYLRLVEQTPRIFELYQRVFGPDQTPQLLEALGISLETFSEAGLNLERLWDRIRTDDNFVRSHNLEALRETISLDYPSYILALAMGAGKTVLIGAIYATEFAMAQEYPSGPFVQNALVFAPGLTIIESLRELSSMPYSDILPPRMSQPFLASLKLTFTRDGEKDVPVIRGSVFNVVITNTEKIRIQKESIRRSDLGTLFAAAKVDEAKSEVANLRLQTIASLPHLAVFSDEAHHTYGQSLTSGLKKVRQTVDYLADNTNLICVINTTGTPYFQRQPLKDVVFWYGLSQGIADGILKDLAGNIQAYEFSGDATAYVDHVLRDFFESYRDVQLPDGAHAKLAMYFPQIDDLEELRPQIDATLLDLGIDTSVCLRNTSQSSSDELEAFNRLNTPDSPHRVILLVNKGTEGWNCPSLFACALVRRLRTSNNFVLQAASRCLRQVPGNQASARVYLSSDNYGVLDRQLTETYGETIEDLRTQRTDRRTRTLVLRKTSIPPLVVTVKRRRIVRKDGDVGTLILAKPARVEGGSLTKLIYTMAAHKTSQRVLTQLGEESLAVELRTTDTYSAAADLAAQYRLAVLDVLSALKGLYPDGEVPLDHLSELAQQIEEQTRFYDEIEEEYDVALALVKPEGFHATRQPDDSTIYTAEITYPKDKEHLLVSLAQVTELNPGDFGFHYDPYNFDSNPEKYFFEQVLTWLNLSPAKVEDVYFTGAITDPAKTDFTVEYKDIKGKWRRYTPDFIIRKRPDVDGHAGRVLIVEIKDENERDDLINGESGRKALALKVWEELNPDLLKYEMLFVATDVLAANRMTPVRHFIQEGRT